MEVSKLSEQGIKIKSKNALFGVDPVGTKGSVDAAIFLTRSLTKEKLALEGVPLIVVGPGEYEVKGVKFNGFEKEQAIIYTARIDNIRVSILIATALPKTRDILEESDVVIINSDVLVDQKLIAALNARVIILYGAQATENAKILGKETITPVSKYVIIKEKLPSEMDVVILG